MDGTFGRGGHSRAILKTLGREGRLIGIDRDPQAVAIGAELQEEDPRFEIVKGEIAALEDIAKERDLAGKVDGLLLDLGVSSPQLDEAERGFSFRHDGPLDMRMDPGTGISAAEWIRTVDEKELRRVLSTYGEEKFSRHIAGAIIRERDVAPIECTSRLAEIISNAVPKKERRIHPATRSFQAIRIFINDELGQLERALAASIKLLTSKGRLCVISFHSLEDRRVKRFMRDASRDAEPYRGMPDVPEDARAPLRLVGKAVAANDAEIEANPRARSARLRIAERR